MRYFLSAAARNESGSTAYFEFQKGAFKNKFWLPDSLYLSAELFDRSGLGPLLRAALPKFAYFGVSRVTKRQWEAILRAAEQADDDTRAIVAELAPWATDCFSDRRVFHILGL